MSSRSVETSLAVVDRTDDGVIFIRIQAGVKLSVEGFGEILAARKELAEGRPAGVVALVPEDVDFDIRIMNVDHYEGKEAATFTAAFAIVTRASLYTRLYELYAAFFKTDFPVKTFHDEAEAVGWVRGYL
ncbi:MAG: hypothetical protein ABI432_09140 [Flavobacteriales bacterium]